MSALSLLNSVISTRACLCHTDLAPTDQCLDRIGSPQSSLIRNCIVPLVGSHQHELMDGYFNPMVLVLPSAGSSPPTADPVSGKPATFVVCKLAFSVNQ